MDFELRRAREKLEREQRERKEKARLKQERERNSKQEAARQREAIEAAQRSRRIYAAEAQFKVVFLSLEPFYRLIIDDPCLILCAKLIHFHVLVAERNIPFV